MLRLIGGLLFAAGIFLFLGNVTGYFRTFSGAGWITLALGGFLFRVAGRQDRPRGGTGLF